jgi:hypothetical protein
MVAAALAAWRATGESVWLATAGRAFAWFHGGNELGIRLYDATSGGCRDGLLEDRSNDNQGAESMLAHLEALLEMQAAGRQQEAGGRRLGAAGSLATGTVPS